MQALKESLSLRKQEIEEHAAACISKFEDSLQEVTADCG